MLIAPTRQHNIIQTAASAKWLVKQIRKALILPLKKKNRKLLQSGRQSVDGSWQIPQYRVTSKMASCKLFLQAFESTKREESFPLFTGVPPPYSTAEQHFLYILTYKHVRSSENKLYSAAEGNSSPHFLFPVPKLSRAFILTVPWSVNGKSLLSTSRLVPAAHTHCTQQKFQSIRQVGPRRWKGRKETYKQ